MAADALAVARSYQPAAAKRQGGIPQFLDKLYHMVEDPNTDLIKWSDSGDSFVVTDQERFSKEILGRWFKHQNFGSFVRQLNLYGFRKVPHLQQGALHSDTSQEPLCFENSNFHRGQPDLLHLISRKKQAAPGREGASDEKPTPVAANNSTARSLTAANGALDVNGLLTGIAAIKRHQTQISTELTELKRSNQALWQEAYSARERYQRQQDTIDRILKFLAGVFGSVPASASQSKDQSNKTADAPGARRVLKRLMIEPAGGKGKAPEAGASRFVEHDSPNLTDGDMEQLEFATPPPEGQPYASISSATTPSLSAPFATDGGQEPFYSLEDMLSTGSSKPESTGTQQAGPSSSYDPTLSLTAPNNAGTPDSVVNSHLFASLMNPSSNLASLLNTPPDHLQKIMTAVKDLATPAASPAALNGSDLLLSHNGQPMLSPPSFYLDGPMNIWQPDSSTAVLNTPNSEIVSSSVDGLPPPLLAQNEHRIQNLEDTHDKLSSNLDSMDASLQTLMEKLGLPVSDVPGNADTSLDQLGLSGQNFGTADPPNFDIGSYDVSGSNIDNNWTSLFETLGQHTTAPAESDFDDFNDEVPSPSPKPAVLALPAETPNVPSKRKPEVAEIEVELPTAKRSSRKKR